MIKRRTSSEMEVEFMTKIQRMRPGAAGRLLTSDAGVKYRTLPFRGTNMKN